MRFRTLQFRIQIWRNNIDPVTFKEIFLFPPGSASSQQVPDESAERKAGDLPLMQVKSLNQYCNSKYFHFRTTRALGQR